MLTKSRSDGELGLPIYQIIYHSQIAIEGGQDSIVEGTFRILEQSRGWNFKNGITGALMVNKDRFSHVIEGPPRAVKTLFGHIVCDERHKNVELLQCKFFEKRAFDNWAMAYVGSPSQADIALATTPHNSDATSATGAKGVLEMLRWLLTEKGVITAVR